MNKKYIDLFKEIAQSAAVCAETVLDFDKTNGDEKGAKTALTMRDDFQELVDKISNLNDNYLLSHSDATKLLVGAMIVVSQLQNKIVYIKNAINGYQEDIIPKLQKIVDNYTTNDDLTEISNQLFDAKKE